MAKTAADIRKDFDTRTESLDLVMKWHMRFAVRFQREIESRGLSEEVRAQLDKQSHFHAAAVTVLERTIKDRQIMAAAFDLGRVPKLEEIDHESLEATHEEAEGIN